MTTTYFNFSPSTSSQFTFQPTLDGQVYTVTVPWSLFGERYYVQIATLQGTVVVLLPLIGSPPDYDISLTAGYFSTTLVYRASTNQFEVTSA
jgi:hypothetical protein